MGNDEVQQLKADLAQFTGTAHYYRIDRKTLLTDGTHYLCEQAGAYWLITVFASYLHELKLEEWFTVLKLDVTGSSAKVTISDGNDSPNNFQNSLNNFENSPNNFRNSPNNFDNSPNNFGATNGVYDNQGNRIGYEVRAPSGVTNIYDNQGNRIGYTPARQR